MGLHLNIYRCPLGDCTNNGVSKSAKGVCVVNAEGPFQPSEDYPAVTLKLGPTMGMRLVPVKNENDWVMAGGNYAGTCDSRFSEAVESMCGYRHNMIEIFDRVEN
jgi:hypothetical protein